MRICVLPYIAGLELNCPSMVPTPKLNRPACYHDGAMIPSKGMQTAFSPGFYLQYGILSVQLKPEFVLAANADFETFNHNQYDVVFARYYDIYNNIDLPARFGTTSYNKAYWGQSSIRLNYAGLSVGISSENLWLIFRSARDRISASEYILPGWNYG